MAKLKTALSRPTPIIKDYSQVSWSGALFIPCRLHSIQMRLWDVAQICPKYARNTIFTLTVIPRLWITVPRLSEVYILTRFFFPHNFQSGFVFGIEFLAAFLMSSAMSILGSKFSYRTLAFLGTFTLGVEVIAFGMLELTHDAVIFLTLSYILRWERSLYVLVVYFSGMHN